MPETKDKTSAETEQGDSSRVTGDPFSHENLEATRNLFETKEGDTLVARPLLFGLPLPWSKYKWIRGKWRWRGFGTPTLVTTPVRRLRER